MTFDDPAVQAVYEAYKVRHGQDIERMEKAGPGGFASRDDFLLPVGEEAGWFLHALIVGRRPARILELGTSYGYSTLFLANAAREVGGKVITMELAEHKQAYAREQLAKVGLDSFVDWRCGDAMELLAAEPGPFDFVFVDLWKDLYAPCLELFHPKLAEEAVIASDNMVDPPLEREKVRRYRDALLSKWDLQTALIPIGQGIELSVKWTPGNRKL